MRSAFIEALGSMRWLFALVLVSCASCGALDQTEVLFEPADRLVDWPAVRLPLHVQDELSRDYYDSTRAAIARLNDRVGCALFVYGGHVDANVPDVRVYHAAPDGLDVDAAAAAFINDRLGSYPSAEVRAYALGDVQEAYLVLYHELGHVLGLAHDLRSRSVMSPDVGSGSFEDGVNVTLQINDRQSSALAAKFCR